MFIFAVPQFSSNHNEKTISKLHEFLNGQQEDLTMLCTIIEYVKGGLQTSLENGELQKYRQTMEDIQSHQLSRYDEIDQLINKNVFQMKKGKTTDNTALVYGKEVRKLESGLRTLILFAGDAIDMIDSSKVTLDRGEARVRYFENRSTSLQTEIATLSKQLSLL